MNRYTLLLLVLCLLIVSQRAEAQVAGMHIHLKARGRAPGGTLTYRTDAVDSLTFVPETYPRSSFVHYGTPDPLYSLHMRITASSSVHFLSDNQGGVVVADNSGDTLRLFPVSPIDREGLRVMKFDELETNTKVKYLTYVEGLWAADWNGSKVYYARPARVMELSGDDSVVSVHAFPAPSALSFLAVDAARDRALWIESTLDYPPAPGLISLATLSTGVPLYQSADSAVAGAVFLKESEDFLYYSYGNLTKPNGTGEGAGFYRHTADTTAFVLPWVPDGDDYRSVMGFDADSTGNTLYVPLTGTVQGVVRVNLTTGAQDTIRLSMSKRWVRLNHAYSRMLYFPAEDSLGVLDLQTLHSDVNWTAPSTGEHWISYEGLWSPDDSAILYWGIGFPLEPGDFVGLSNMYIWKLR